MDEAAEQILPAWRVVDFRVELDGVQAGVGRLKGGHRSVGRGGGHHGTGRWLGDGVEVAHPNRVGAASSVNHKSARFGNDQVGAAVLSPLVAAHRAPPLVRDELGAVADTQDGHAEFIDAGVDARGTVHVDRGRPATENDPGRCPGGELLSRQVVGNDLAIDVGLTHPSGDELRVLGPEVDDQDAVGGVGTPTRDLGH